jgi:hypothetical protein
MEDWDTYFVLIIPYLMSRPGMPENVKELLAPLWLGLVYFLRYRPGQEGDEHVDSAQRRLLRYCKKAQEAFRLGRLATLQLHTAAVHMLRTAKAWGPIRFCLEF